MSLTRRSVLGAFALTAGSAVLPALAAAPKAGAQVPGVFRQTIGDFEITALLDGEFQFEPQMFPAAKPEEMKQIIERSYHAMPPRAHVNAFAVNTGQRLYLVDTGTGSAFGPDLGKVWKNLPAAGIAPERVDTLLITHLHPDHVGGAANGGASVYPRAELIYPEVDGTVWLNEAEAAKAPKDFQPFFRVARDSVAPYASRTRKIATKGDIAPGIEAVPLPGHTIGHIGYLVGTGKDRLLIWGDLVHNAALQFPRPDWSIAFDADMAQAAATRKRVLDMAATDRLMVAGMHLPFPGIGHVGREVQGYSLHPVFWRG